MNSLAGKKVLIVGLGRSGIAAARFVSNRGASVTVSEQRNEADMKDACLNLADLPITFSFGKNDPDLMRDSDIIVLSPGVPLTVNGLEDAKKRGIPIIGELELAIREIKTPVIAVTGTNGKTTTVALLHHVLRTCGISSCLGGNVGTPLTSLVDQSKNVDWIVLEVSSFQIETTPSLTPKIAVLLNITPDHLDRHQSFEEYIELKTGLFKMLGAESIGIYNAADKVITGAIDTNDSRLIPFNVASEIKSGGWCDKQSLRINLPHRSSVTYDLKEVQLRGSYNCENMLAVVIAASLCGGKTIDVQKGLETFSGLPHRVEFIGEYNGVSYYNDSKGTNVGATVAALENFEQPVILIAGGLDKGSSYSPLAQHVKDHVKKLVLIGEAKEKIKNELGAFAETVFAETMDEAVLKAEETARPGDVVLLSPACASYDMFNDYVERGEAFINAVKTIGAGGVKNKRIKT